MKYTDGEIDAYAKYVAEAKGLYGADVAAVRQALELPDNAYIARWPLTLTGR